jgi:hypothetical protein
LKKDSEPIFTSEISLWDDAKTYLKNKGEHDVQSFLAPSLKQLKSCILDMFKKSMRRDDKDAKQMLDA